MSASGAKRRPRKPAARRTAVAVEVLVQSPRWRAQPRASAIVRNAISAAASAVSTQPAELAIVLTDDSAIHALNRDWRGHDKPTNVLSFPAVPPRGDRAADAGPRPLGDVIIAYQTVAREARAEGKPLSNHLAHLAVHGFLHLLGYDHETSRDARRMETLETRILADLGVPDPYASRER